MKLSVLKRGNEQNKENQKQVMQKSVGVKTNNNKEGNTRIKEKKKEEKERQDKDEIKLFVLKGKKNWRIRKKKRINKSNV